MARNLPWIKKAKSKASKRGKAIPRPASRIIPEDARCFIPQRRGNDVYHIVDPQYTEQERKEICRKMPAIMKESRLHTEAELEAHGWIFMKSGEKHFKECDEGSHLFGIFMGPRDMNRLGLLAKMGRLREIITNQDFQKFLAKHQRSKDGVKPRTYNMLASIQHPASTRNVRIQLGAHAREMNELAIEHNQLCTELSTAVLDGAYSEETKDILKRRSKINGGMCCGSRYNSYTNAIQINLSEIDDSGLSSLSDPAQIGVAGQTHVDEHDDPTRHSVILYLGHFGPNTFPGRFCLLSLKITCTLEPLGALVMAGVDAHCGLGEGQYEDSIPVDYPLRYRPPQDLVLPSLPSDTPYIRANTVVYSSKPLMLYENFTLNEELNEDAGIAHFGDKASQMEWKMQRHLRKLLEVPKPVVSLPTADEVVSMFGWQDPATGAMQYPRRSVAEDCLSYDRKSDPAWEKLLVITQKTRSSLNEIKIQKDPAERARINQAQRGRKENARRRAAGLPELPIVVAPKLKVKKNKGDTRVIKQSTDPTIWTDEDYVSHFDAAVDIVAGGEIKVS